MSLSIATVDMYVLVGYLVAVVASQLLSPILWDHYAVLLLLPVAWLLDRGHWWVMVIPLASSIALVAHIPPLVSPLARRAAGPTKLSRT